jgi:uncharacterized membrane protein YdjX (TVP38/TMEM64 family)
MAEARLSQAPDTSAGGGKLPLSRIAIVIAAIGVLYFLGRQAGHYVPQFAEWVASLGVWGPIVFVVGYAIAVVAFVPGSILTLAAGAIFGLVQGVIVVFIAAVIGSCAAFLVSRYIAREWVEHRLADNPKFAAIDRAVAREGRKIIFLLRLSPLFPFNLLNYALGLTKVSFVDYAIAALGMLPGTLLYVYYGKLAGDVAALAGGAAQERGAEYYAVLALGLVATVVVATVVGRMARKALGEVTEA